tara:strand:+ start:18292 stop:19302 length:1011 start_codon:yes stop_codon:yes gene_type:complete
MIKKHVLKKRSNLKICLTLLIFALTFTACDLSNDDGDKYENYDSIIKLIESDPNLSSLLSALDVADSNLPTVFGSSGAYTLLAPTNSAFETFLDGRTLSEIPKAELTQLLLNHIISGRVTTTVFNNAIANDIHYTTTYAESPETDDNSTLSIYFENEEALTFNGISKVIATGIEANNGIIYKVDAVIPLPSILTFITVDDQFSSLEAALTAEGQPDFISILSTANGTSPAPFTLFAPTNDAFTDLGTLPTGDALTAVLQHHVVTSTNIRGEEIISGDAINATTLEGDDISFEGSVNAIFIKDGSGNSDSKIISGNIQGSNGVIHAITKVLIPDTTN